MEKDIKFTIFIKFFTSFVDKSVISQLVKQYIDKISKFLEQQILEYIVSHSSSQYVSLLYQLCTTMLIDVNRLLKLEKQQFCTYIFYFHTKLQK